MVKRGGKEVITVEIFKETYDAMKLIATRKRWSAKDYINTVLIEAIERDKFLHSYSPSLSRVGYQDNILFIRFINFSLPIGLSIKHSSSLSIASTKARYVSL